MTILINKYPADDPLEWIVGLHLAPVIARKREVRQRLVRLGSTNSAALVRRIAGSLTITSRTVSSAERRSLLGMDGLQHSSDVGDLASARFYPYPLIEKDLLRSH